MSDNYIYNERELLFRLAEGDEAVFSDLYRQYWQKLFVYIVRIIRSEPDAEDLLQELFSSLWKRREQLTAIESLSAYLFTSARYLCVAYVENRLTHSQQLSLLADYYKKVAVPSEAEMAIRIEELQRQLEKAIRELPPRVKEVFILSRKYHLSHKEIANELGISEQTVKKQVQYALKIIRPAINRLVVWVAVIHYMNL